MRGDGLLLLWLFSRFSRIRISFRFREPLLRIRLPYRTPLSDKIRRAKQPHGIAVRRRSGQKILRRPCCFVSSRLTIPL